MALMFKGVVLLLTLFCLKPATGVSALLPVNSPLPPSHAFDDPGKQAAVQKAGKRLALEFKAKGFIFGAPILFRSFKSMEVPKILTRPGMSAEKIKDEWKHASGEGKLELWVQDDDGHFRKFRTYSVCGMEGLPGPKRNENDYMSPEGFYEISPGTLDPNSWMRLSIDVGYPNAYDIGNRAKGRSGAGNAIKIHGACVTEGCLAMNDDQIDEIYAVVSKSLNRNVWSNGSVYKIPFYSFPFPLSPENLKKLDTDTLRNLSSVINRDHSTEFDVLKFWTHIQIGYEYFELERSAPDVSVQKTLGGVEYQFGRPSSELVQKK
ncbi:MAG: hypothetical protein H7301_04200 [Cryobacterium sp.]|nr:hypothetical protein [Oligoflexia bacterium]